MIIKTDYVKVIPTRWGNMACFAGDGYFRAALEYYGEYAPDELALCLQCIKPGDVVIDAGAHIGTFAVPFARRVGPTGHVCAFEPQRLAYMALTTNLFINCLGEWTTPICAALGAEVGRCKVHRIDPRAPNTNIGGARLNDPDNISGIPILGEQEDAPMTTIDAMGYIRLDFIKIDTEGMDAAVIAGGKETIKRCRPVILTECLEGDEQPLKDILADLDYRGYRITTGLYSPQNVRLETENVFGDAASFDVIAFPKEKATQDYCPLEVVPIHQPFI